MPSITAQDASGSYSFDTAGEISSPDVVNRMVVRNGNMQLVVKEITPALDNITNIAKDNGGYVVSSQKWKDSDRNYGSITIRVQAENYDRTIAALRTLAVSVTSETTSSQDVTEEYTDLDQN